MRDFRLRADQRDARRGLSLLQQVGPGREHHLAGSLGAAEGVAPLWFSSTKLPGYIENGSEPGMADVPAGVFTNAVTPVGGVVVVSMCTP